MHAPFSSPASPTTPPARSRGTAVVAGMLATALALAAFAVWFQWRQTRRCLDFYGGDVARLVQTALRVELWRLDPTTGDAPPQPRMRTVVTTAPGIVHLRRGLVEDANFVWNGRASPGGRPTWSVALAFFPETGAEPAVLLFDTGAETPAVSVAGRPGFMVPGAIAAGLRTWLAEAEPTAAKAAEAR